MSFKPVRSRGQHSPQGRQHARELTRIKAPYLKRYNADGSVSRKRKGDLTVTTSTHEENPQDGFYSLGVIDNKYHIMASQAGRGHFRDRGPAGDETFTFPALGFYGRGAGMVPVTLEGPPNKTDFLGQAILQYRTLINKTRSGRTFTPVYEVTYCAPAAAGQAWVAFHGGRVVDANPSPTQQTPVFQTTASVVQLNNDGQYVPTFLIDTAQGLTVVPAQIAPNQLVAEAVVAKFGTQNYVMLCPCLWPYNGPGAVDTANTPGVMFQTSSDAGRTWAISTALDPVFGAEMATIRAALPSWTSGRATHWNNLMTTARLIAYQPAPGMDLFVAVVPFMDGSSPKARVKAGRRNHLDGSYTVTATLYEGSLSNALIYYGAGGIEFSLQGITNLPGVLLFVRPITGNEGAEPRQVLWFDESGVYPLGVMPEANHRTGVVSAVSRGELICPMCIGYKNFYLFSSRDGLAWVKRATISEMGVQPSVGDLALYDFGQVTYLRNDGRPALLTPSAPWASDYRKGL